MNNNSVSFDGFEAFTGGISSRGAGSDSDYEIVNPSVITGKPEDDDIDDEDIVDDDKVIETTKPIVTSKVTKEDDEEEEDSDKDDSKSDKSSKTDSSDADEVTDLGEMEEDITEFVQDKLFAEFGWDAEDKKFKSIKEVVDFVKDVIEENSTPQYASEELVKIDEYVKNGGDLKNYLTDVYGGIDVDKVDLDNVNDCKAIVREQLLAKGYNESTIRKRIDRYEDTGILKEEASEAQELLKEYKAIKAQKLLEEQKIERASELRRQQEFVKGVEDTINSVDNIRGIAVSAAEKKKLMDYMFRPTADGMTQYQKDYAKNSKNLIESAYFTMKGDTLLQKIQTQANTNAARRLKERLAEKGRRANDQGDFSAESSTSWGQFSSQIRKPY